MKCLNCWDFVTAHSFLTGWHLFTFFTVAPFLRYWSYRISASSWLLSTLKFGRVCLAYIGSNWKPRILFSLLQYSPEKLSKLWHGNSCFAFRKKFLGFIFFLILFSCSTQLFKNQLKHTQDEYVLFVCFYFQVACNCSNSSKQEVKHSYYNLSVKGEK